MGTTIASSKTDLTTVGLNSKAEVEGMSTVISPVTAIIMVKFQTITLVCDFMDLTL